MFFPTEGLLRLVVQPTQCGPWIRLCNYTWCYNESMWLVTCAGLHLLYRDNMTSTRTISYDNGTTVYLTIRIILVHQRLRFLAGTTRIFNWRIYSTGVVTRYYSRNLIDLYDAKPEPLRGRVSGHLLNIGSHWFTLHIGTGFWHQERGFALPLLFWRLIGWITAVNSEQSGMHHIRCFKQKHQVTSLIWCWGHFQHLGLSLWYWTCFLAAKFSW